MKNKQKEVLSWAVDTFGPIASDKQERVKRFAEEAIELCQACGLSRDLLTKIVSYTYNRECGAIHKEIGQVGVTLATLAEVCGEDMGKEINNEFERISSIDKSVWQARQNKKAEIGIGGFCGDVK